MATDTGAAADCTRCCCSFILTSGLTALFLWLSLRTSTPSFFIHRFDIPPLNLSAPPTTNPNHTIDFDLELRNTMKDKGVSYGNISLSFSYKSSANNSVHPIANLTLPEFYQGHGKKARRRSLVNVNNGSRMAWEEVIGEVRKREKVSFRVEVKSRVKYKILFWFTKRHGVEVGGDVEVNGGGEMEKKKGVRLKSGAPPMDGFGLRVGSLMAVSLFLGFILCYDFW